MKVAAACGLLLATAGWAADEAPRPTDRVEHTEARLALIDLTVVGPPELVSRLRPEDLSLKVQLRRVREFQLDRLCAAAPDEAPGPLPRPSYLLFFDQAQLTLPGRLRALELAREIVPRLVRDGARAMIISSAAELIVVEPLSSDAARLLAALDRLENDRRQWDPYATQEDERVAHVVDALNEPGGGGIRRAIGLARGYQKEETFRSDKSLSRLALGLGRLANLEQPKAVLYFADTLRANPGEHYLRFFGQTMLEGDATLQGMVGDISRGRLAFDRVVNVAAAQNIRFYPVQAQGLVQSLDPVVPTASAAALLRRSPGSSRLRVSDAQDALSNLATESGGNAFLNGVGASKIAERIRGDFFCVYLLSFDPSPFPEDAPLAVAVESRLPGVQVRARGRLFLESEAERRITRLLGAFTDASGAADFFELSTRLVPIGYERERYVALLQVRVPPTSLVSAVWDVGASVVGRDSVRAEASGRLAIDRSGVPVILEEELRLAPGAYDVVAVAHEIGSGLVGSAQARIDWPDPDRSPATVGPIVVLQPDSGAFVRDGKTRHHGPLARSEGEAVRTQLPAALVALVCRSEHQAPTLTVERKLLGENGELAPLTLSLEDQRCAQVRDLIPADGLHAGYHRYEVRVLRGEHLLAESALEFTVEDEVADAVPAPRTP
ncbi:MAG TPA: hypothetical protein VJS92_11010 [Candidatus Polarisedimenticolaceae bacterium]|nr:hypothetical protein [Candidatus Polarisedimenticolaceae bacterium]